MSNLKCKTCGGEIEIVDENNIFCRNCGARYTLSLVGDMSIIKERVGIFLNNREWDKADEYAEQILDKYPHSSFAYKTKLMAKYGLKNDDSFLELYETRFIKDVNFKMMSLSNPEEVEEWRRIIQIISENHQRRKVEDCFEYCDFPINNSQAFGFLWSDISGFDEKKERAVDAGQYEIACKMEDECFVLKQPYIGVYKKNNIGIEDTLGMLEECVKSQREYLIILSSYGNITCNDEFLHALYVNCIKGVLKGVVVVTSDEYVNQLYSLLNIDESKPYVSVESVYVNCGQCSVSVGRQSN